MDSALKTVEPISETCVLDISMDIYHSDCCDSISLSSGDLVAISENPAKWYINHWSNPNREPKEDKQVFRFGRAAHAIVVGGEVFDENYDIRPDEFKDYRTKAAREWRDDVIKAGRTPLTPDEMTVIQSMANAIVRSPEALALFEAGKPEQSLFWKRDGVWLKARPDLIPEQDSRIILDYKTVASVDPRKLEKQITDNGWFQKLANVTDGMIATGMVNVTSLDELEFALVCQEKTAPYEVVVVVTSADVIADMMRLNQRALQEFKEAQDELKTVEPISETCVLDISMDIYHSDCCDSISLSSGDLVAISKNPAKWYANHWSNPNLEPKEDKQVFRFGRAAHAIVVGGEVFDENYEIRPDEFKDYRTKAAREWRDAVIAEGRTPLTPDEMTVIQSMANAIVRSPEALALFEAGKPEQSLFWKRDGVWLKARPDLIPDQDSRIILDYKTVASVDPRKLTMQITDNGWFQKLANVTDGMIATGMVNVTSLDELEFALVCQEKTAPYEVVVVVTSADVIADMMRLNQRALQEFKEAQDELKRGAQFPYRGRNDGFIEYALEEWMLNSMAQRYGGADGLPTLDLNLNNKPVKEAA